METNMPDKKCLQLVTACISMSVGLGNIWRFPFIMLENGGGTFLVCYVVILLLFSKPLYFLELGLGQFSSKASLKMFHSLAPAFTGIGALQVFATVCVSSYYASLLSICIYYIANSFSYTLPWGKCFSNYGDKCLPSENLTSLSNMTSSTELFLTKFLFNETENLDDGIGVPNWKLVLPLVVTWCGIFCEFKTSRNSPACHPFLTGLHPYFMLFIMFGVAISQKGSTDGFFYFLIVKWEQLLDAKIWFNAISQCLYSLGVGFGTITLLGSHSPFNCGMYYISGLVPLIDFTTSFLSGLTTFAILGNMAYHLNTTVENVIKSGSIGVFFIANSYAFTKIPAILIGITILYFLMMYALGLCTLVVLQEVIIAQIVDYTGIKPWKIAAVTSVIGCATGLIYITPGGMYMMQLVDLYGVSMIIYVAVFLEILCIVLGYGLRNICLDFEFLTSRKIGIRYRCIWGIIAPIFLAVVFVLFVIRIANENYIKRIPYPTTALIAGWLLFISGVMSVVGFALCNIYSRKSAEYSEMFWDTFNQRSWSPASQTINDDWLSFREFIQNGGREEQSNVFINYLKTLCAR